MHVCVCIFWQIHTSYRQQVSHTYKYKHAGSLMSLYSAGRGQPAQAADLKSGSDSGVSGASGASLPSDRTSQLPNGAPRTSHAEEITVLGEHKYRATLLT